MCESEKVRIFVVSSYHREYLWSQATQDGLCSAMLRLGYLEDQEQIDKFTTNAFNLLTVIWFFISTRVYPKNRFCNKPKCS